MEHDLSFRTEEVRNSIKKKLHDLNFSDDNLTVTTDYIMFMLTNRRSRESMRTELYLFLDQHAASFTDWLYGMLDNLEKDATKRLEESKDNLNDVSAVLEGETSETDEEEVVILFIKLRDDQSLLKEDEGTSKESSQKEKESAQSTSSLYRKKTKPVPVIQQKDRKKPVVPGPLNNQQPETKSSKPVCKSTVVKVLKRTVASTHDPGVKSAANVIPAKQKKAIVPQSREVNTILLPRKVQEANRFVSSQLKQHKFPSRPPAAPKPAVSLQFVDNKTDADTKTDTASKKLNDKCYFWPKCKFGNNCRYIHPKCKYDASCSRNDCHFMHTVKRDFAKFPSVQLLCRVQKCHFGKHCKSKECPFAHSAYPSQDQMRWTAPFSSNVI